MYDYRPKRFENFPPVVKNLIIINVILAFAQHVLFGSFHIDLQDYLGLHYFRSGLFRPWQLVTHMFMHGSPQDIDLTILHLFSNMFGLWMFGRILENRWGARRFLIFYFVCGLGAAACQLGVMSLQVEPVYDSYKAFMGNPTLAQFEIFVKHHAANDELLKGFYQEWLQQPMNEHTGKVAQYLLQSYMYGGQLSANIHLTGILNDGMVGASVAIMGILFAFGYLYPNLELMLLFLPIPIKAKWFVGFYAAFELYSGIRASAGDNVAHFAHLGGMLFAFILLRLWRYRFGDR